MRDGVFLGSAEVADGLAVAYEDHNGRFHTQVYEPDEVAEIVDAANDVLRNGGDSA